MAEHSQRDTAPAGPGPDHIRLSEEYYVLAPALAPRQPQVLLNHADSFAIFDLAGDIPIARRESYGLFHRGTRFLNRFELRLNGQFPILLSTFPTHEGSALVTYLSNADELSDGEVTLLRDTLAIRRSKTLLENTLYEALHLHNYGGQALRLELELLFAADFADVFELRGTGRARRGVIAAPVVERDCLRLPYQGVDGVRRETVLRFFPAPRHLGATNAYFQVELGPGEETSLEIHAACHLGDLPSPSHTFASALAAVCHERTTWRQQFPTLSSDNEDFNAWLDRSLQDLAMLRTVGPHGSYVYAGIPWFATVFGRDGLITALETLAFSPDLAAGTLRTLASLQGQQSNSERDEEPGKILHEMRFGEMAATGEIPFGRYYGSVDATPLFLLVLAEYGDRTGDLALVQELWPAAVAAMRWIDAVADEAGYVTYARRTPRGLVNQGWKDSHDAISHADGTLAEPPIALAEVQAYVYAARRGLARLARRLGHFADSATWDAQAARLQEGFHRDFWLADEGTFALALDGHGRPCRVVSSNAGHCLFGGIAEGEKARQVISRLMRDDMFCGWGVRTLSTRARRYNPMSYHNGSVWPHDNALIAAGFARYGAGEQVQQLLTAIFNASLGIENRRLPELFCGFARHQHPSPVPYPVACKPQAWAAGSVFLLLQAVLGLRIDAWERRVTFERATLPPWLNRLDIRGLYVRQARLDLSITRGHWHAAVEVLKREGEVEVVVRT
jgi:glycogen debranching enzyme